MPEDEDFILYREESHEIMESAFSVYNNLGSGFLEAIYQEALEVELRERVFHLNLRKRLLCTTKENLSPRNISPTLL